MKTILSCPSIPYHAQTLVRKKKEDKDNLSLTLYTKEIARKCKENHLIARFDSNLAWLPWLLDQAYHVFPSSLGLVQMWGRVGGLVFGWSKPNKEKKKAKPSLEHLTWCI